MKTSKKKPVEVEVPEPEALVTPAPQETQTNKRIVRPDGRIIEQH